MSILFVLIPLGLVLLAAACVAFAWAARNGQFEDLDRAATSILLEESEQNDARAPAEDR